MSAPEHIKRVRLLYKTILKLHRGLPEELHSLGQNYVRDEFKRHKQCNQAESALFLLEWTKYALVLAEQLGLRGPKTGSAALGQHLEDEELEKFRDDQIGQLYELMIAAQVKKSDSTDSKEN